MTVLLFLFSCFEESNDPGYIPGVPNPYSNRTPPKLSLILDGSIPIEELTLTCEKQIIPHQKTDKEDIFEFDIEDSHDSCILMREKQPLIEMPIAGKVWCDKKGKSIVCIK